MRHGAVPLGNPASWSCPCLFEVERVCVRTGMHFTEGEHVSVLFGHTLCETMFMCLDTCWELCRAADRADFHTVFAKWDFFCTDLSLIRLVCVCVCVYSFSHRFLYIALCCICRSGSDILSVDSTSECVCVCVCGLAHRPTLSSLCW